MEIIRQWCEGIIIAILISLIIELLVPEGDNKKYVKVVIGIYIVFVVINPLLKFFKYDFDFSSVINVPVEEVNSKTDSIKEFYVEGIKESIKEDIEKLGYIIDNIEISFDSNFRIRMSSLVIRKNIHITTGIAFWITCFLLDNCFSS